MIKILKGLLVNSFYLYLIQGLNYLLPLFVLPYLLQVLDSESFGIFAYSQALVQFLILIVDFGFNLTITKKIASLPKNSPEIISLFWQITFIKLIFFIVLSISVVIVFNLVPSLEIYRTAVFWSLITLLGVVLFPVWLFQGLNKMKAMSIINALAKLLTFPFIFFLVQEKGDSIEAVLLHSGSYLLAGIIAAFLVLRKPEFWTIPWKEVSLEKMIAEVKYSWPVFLSNSAVSLYTTSLTIFLGFFASASQVGAFGAIERIVRAVCFGIYVPINQAAYPALARLAATDFVTAKKLLRVLFYAVFAGMSVVCILFLLVDSWIIEHFLHEFDDIKLLLRISIFTIIPISLGAVCGQLGLLALGSDEHKQKFSRVYIFTGLVSLPVSVLCIKYFLVNGTVFTMVLTEITIFIGMYYNVKKFKFL